MSLVAEPTVAKWPSGEQSAQHSRSSRLRDCGRWSRSPARAPPCIVHALHGVLQGGGGCGRFPVAVRRLSSRDHSRSVSPRRAGRPAGCRQSAVRSAGRPARPVPSRPSAVLLREQQQPPASGRAGPGRASPASRACLGRARCAAAPVRWLRSPVFPFPWPLRALSFLPCRALPALLRARVRCAHVLLVPVTCACRRGAGGMDGASTIHYKRTET